MNRFYTLAVAAISVSQKKVLNSTHTKIGFLTKSVELRKVLADNVGSLTKHDKTVINPQIIIFKWAT